MTDIQDKADRVDADKPMPVYRSFTVEGVKVTVHRRILEDRKVQRILARLGGLKDAEIKRNPEKMSAVFDLPEELFGDNLEAVEEQVAERNDGIVPSEELLKIAVETVRKLRPST